MAYSPEEQTLENEKTDRLYTAIKRLDEKHRLPIILKYLNGMTEAEVAMVLSIPLSTVKSRLYVARQRLKASLQAEKRGEQGA